MLRGLATISFWADDLKAAQAWYTELLGIAPYFERPDSENPAYIEFRLGDYQHELGIIDTRYAPPGAAAGPGGVVAYWHVDDVAATLVNYAVQQSATHLVVGQSDVSRWREITRGSVINRLQRMILQRGTRIDLYIVTSSSRV